MDLEDAVETTPGLLGADSQVRLVPFFAATIEKPMQQHQQPNNCFKQPTNGQSTEQRHNSALAVSIETDVWLLGMYSGNVYIIFLVHSNDKR